MVRGRRLLLPLVLVVVDAVEADPAPGTATRRSGTAGNTAIPPACGVPGTLYDTRPGAWGAEDSCVVKSVEFLFRYGLVSSACACACAVTGTGPEASAAKGDGPHVPTTPSVSGLWGAGCAKASGGGGGGVLATRRNATCPSRPMSRATTPSRPTSTSAWTSTSAGRSGGQTRSGEKGDKDKDEDEDEDKNVGAAMRSRSHSTSPRGWVRRRWICAMCSEPSTRASLCVLRSSFGV